MEDWKVENGRLTMDRGRCRMQDRRCRIGELCSVHGGDLPLGLEIRRLKVGMVCPVRNLRPIRVAQHLDADIFPRSNVVCSLWNRQDGFSLGYHLQAAGHFGWVKNQAVLALFDFAQYELSPIDLPAHFS